MPILPTQQLVGVVEDAASPAVFLPVNVRQGVELQAGATLNLLVQTWTRGGLPVSSSEGTFTLSVGQNPYGGQPLLRKAGVAAPQFGGNTVLFSFAPADTTGRLPGAGQYVYDVWLEDTHGNRMPVIPTSPFTVLGGIPP